MVLCKLSATTLLQVTVNGTVMTFSGSADLQFIGTVTGLSLVHGVTYTVSVVARNSIGDSETFNGTVFVPCEWVLTMEWVLCVRTYVCCCTVRVCLYVCVCITLLPTPPPLPLSPAVPPNITMQPVAVTPDEATTRCCAGVLVFLEHPSDPTLVFTAQVNTEGSPFTARNVTREGDVVYVQGLQAGTPYNIRLTGRNQLGSVMANITTTPLLGEPLYTYVCTYMCILYACIHTYISYRQDGECGARLSDVCQCMYGLVSSDYCHSSRCLSVYISCFTAKRRRDSRDIVRTST